MSDTQPAGAPTAYWHLWTDDDGVSRQDLTPLGAMQQACLNPGASAQWSLDLVADGNAFLSVLPVGWVSDWHENTVPKWIFVLSGRWYVESMDGQRQVFGPGDFSFGGDQDTVRSADGRFGHLSGQVGDAPCVQLILQRNGDGWRGARPGAFS
ncbi:MAG: cupin domain-containing protein [Cyanobium sp. CZS 25K]|nr:cupin domain-containing protein [Cyanobium sp. CZS25K]